MGSVESCTKVTIFPTDPDTDMEYPSIPTFEELLSDDRKVILSRLSSQISMDPQSYEMMHCEDILKFNSIGILVAEGQVGMIPRDPVDVARSRNPTIIEIGLSDILTKSVDLCRQERRKPMVRFYIRSGGQSDEIRDRLRAYPGIKYCRRTVAVPLEHNFGHTGKVIIAQSRFSDDPESLLACEWEDTKTIAANPESLKADSCIAGTFMMGNIDQYVVILDAYTTESVEQYVAFSMSRLDLFDDDSLW